MSSMRWPLTRRLWRANTPARYEIQTNSNGKQVFARVQTNQTTTPSKYINKRASAKPSTTSFFHTNTSICSPSTSTSSSSHSNPHIHRIAITIHGYLGLPRPFFLWRQSLTEAGFEVVDYAYDSGGSMETIANGLNQLLRRTIRDVSQRHPSIDEVQFNFICHSMGGLVLRAAINSGFFPIPIRGIETSQEKPASHHRLAVNRVVMIATPNQGSEYARTLAKYPTLKKVVLGFARLRIPGAKRLRGLTPIDDSKDSPSIGAATTELLACGDLIMTRSPEWFRTNWTWPRVLYPRTLVIAGTLSLLQGLTPTTSDGTITFEETKLPPPPPSTIETATESDGDASTDPLPPLPNSAVSFGPCNSQHMSFHAQHSLLLTHPGVIQASVNFIQTGRPE